ncbi:MAG: pyridoxamine 5'-phosphate oxidase [Anditalea sp.]
MNLADIRKEYILKSFELEELAESPIDQFHIWLNEALIAEAMEVNAMNVATINTQNRPSSRIVLLKGVDHGFIFYTNYESKKGKELKNNPFAALNFFWPELERQVRIEGEVEKVASEISDEYFLSRPIGSQVGAWTSPQSKVIPNRSFLVNREKEMFMRFQKEPLKRPEHWGGYRVIPYYMEFWQGGASRLHDRIAFEKGETGIWTKKRLAP